MNQTPIPGQGGGLSGEIRKRENMSNSLSWKAVRRGAIYCAPACGARCTYAQYKLAKNRAEQLARRLGKGWTPKVWENLGWHYKAVSPCGRIKVHASHYGEGVHYSAFLGEPNSGGGRWAQDGKTPEEAISRTIETAKEDLRKVGAVLKGL